MKEIKEHPNNAYAYYFMAHIYGEQGDFENALQTMNIAIKKMPKKDKVHLSRSYATRAQLYYIAGDTIRCLSEYNMAVKVNPNDCDILENRADLLFELERYDESNADYRKIVEMNPLSETGYMGLGRNAIFRENYDEAIKQYDKILAMYDDYSSGYVFRGRCYQQQGKYREAIEDEVKSLSIDGSPMAYLILNELPQDQIPLAVVKMKAMAVKDANNSMWPYLIGGLCREKRMYQEAIDAYKDAYDIDATPFYLEYIAICYSELGEYTVALETINQALQMDPSNSEYIQVKAEILGDSGDMDGAIAEWTSYIEKNPDYFGGYYRRGFFEENSGRRDEALEDYNMSIMLDPDYAYAYLSKGDILTLRGDLDEAKAAYEKVVELDTFPNNSSCAMYALLALGEKERAIDFMDKFLALDPLDSDNYYDGACFYSRLGEFDKSLEYLRKSLELGFKRFHHIYADDDLDPLKETEAFKALMQEYLPSADQPDDDSKDEETSSFHVEIPYTPEGGCANVKCTINGLPLNFIFDTGASTVSMSMLEANFMLKNGYLHEDDIVGSQWFVDANGDISEGTVVILRAVDFGGLTLNNVRASVVRNQKAPLLLGQSVLGRMGSIEIDNKNKKLIITNHSKSK